MPSSRQLVKPRRSPQELAELVSRLSNLEKAELMYDLVLFAAVAAQENDCGPLRSFLAEVEDLAMVFADPQRRRELQQMVNEASHKVPAAVRK